MLRPRSDGSAAASTRPLRSSGRDEHWFEAVFVLKRVEGGKTCFRRYHPAPVLSFQGHLPVERCPRPAP
eukprot:scaffold99821_cov61-Phaeocystis_antarctica.AAC.2